jgi:hypothetical protein
VEGDVKFLPEFPEFYKEPGLAPYFFVDWKIFEAAGALSVKNEKG